MPVTGPFCLFWRETHTKDLHARYPTRPEEDEGGNVRERDRQTDRQRESAEEIRTENRSVDRSQQRRIEGGREQSTEVRKVTAKTC